MEKSKDDKMIVRKFKLKKLKRLAPEATLVFVSNLEHDYVATFILYPDFNDMIKVNSQSLSDFIRKQSKLKGDTAEYKVRHLIGDEVHKNIYSVKAKGLRKFGSFLQKMIKISP